MHVHLLVLIVGAAIIVAMIELLRRQRLKERYTVLWFATAIGVAVLAVFPRLLDIAADAVGIQSGPHLLFLLAVIALGLVCIQLSVEVSRLEERTRTLAEEVALLRAAVQRVETQPGVAPQGVPERNPR